jgi:hypothetical protein
MTDSRNHDIARTAAEINREYPVFLLHPDQPELIRTYHAAISQIPQGKLDAIAVVALAVITAFAREEGGKAFPSVKTLAYWVGVSERRINQALGDLRKGGWLTETRRFCAPTIKSVTIPPSVRDSLEELSAYVFGIGQVDSAEFACRDHRNAESAFQPRSQSAESAFRLSRNAENDPLTVVVVKGRERNRDTTDFECEEGAEVLAPPEPPRIVLPDCISDSLIEDVRRGISAWPQDGGNLAVHPTMARMLIHDTLKVCPSDHAERVIQDTANALLGRKVKDHNHSRTAWRGFWWKTVRNILTNIQGEAAAERIREAKERAELDKIERERQAFAEVQAKRPELAERAGEASVCRKVAEAPFERAPKATPAAPRPKPADYSDIREQALSGFGVSVEFFDSVGAALLGLDGYAPPIGLAAWLGQIWAEAKTIEGLDAAALAFAVERLNCEDRRPQKGGILRGLRTIAGSRGEQQRLRATYRSYAMNENPGSPAFQKWASVAENVADFKAPSWLSENEERRRDTQETIADDIERKRKGYSS